MNTPCRDCLAGLEHCHGTIICHIEGRPECTEADCVAPELFAHTFVIDCNAIGCRCADVEATRWSAHRVGA